MFTNSSGDLKEATHGYPELLQCASLIHHLFSPRSMVVEEFIIQDKSIYFSVTSSAVLLIPSLLCVLIGLQSSVVLAALVLLPTLSNDTKANFTPTSRSV